MINIPGSQMDPTIKQRIEADKIESCPEAGSVPVLPNLISIHKKNDP